TTTGNEFDPNLTDNTRTATTTVVPAADLSITKTGAPSVPLAGKPLTYTVVVVNNGPSNATSTTMTDTLPLGVVFGSVTTTQGTCSAIVTITCSLGTLNSGMSATVIIVVTPAASGAIINTATVASPVADPTAANNTASL